MKNLVLLNKVNCNSTGYFIILPQEFNVRIEGTTEDVDVNIAYSDKDENLIASTPLVLPETYSKLLAGLSTIERIQMDNKMMHRICYDIAKFAATTTVEDYEECKFQEGVVPMEIFEDDWADFLKEVIDELYELRSNVN